MKYFSINFEVSDEYQDALLTRIVVREDKSLEIPDDLYKHVQKLLNVGVVMKECDMHVQACEYYYTELGEKILENLNSQPERIKL